jgi:hypothetical protein
VTHAAGRVGPQPQPHARATVPAPWTRPATTAAGLQGTVQQPEQQRHLAVVEHPPGEVVGGEPPGGVGLRRPVPQACRSRAYSRASRSSGSGAGRPGLGARPCSRSVVDTGDGPVPSTSCGRTDRVGVVPGDGEVAGGTQPRRRPTTARRRRRPSWRPAPRGQLAQLRVPADARPARLGDLPQQRGEVGDGGGGPGVEPVDRGGLSGAADEPGDQAVPVVAPAGERSSGVANGAGSACAASSTSDASPVAWTRSTAAPMSGP